MLCECFLKDISYEKFYENNTLINHSYHNYSFYYLHYYLLFFKIITRSFNENKNQIITSHKYIFYICRM